MEKKKRVKPTGGFCAAVNCHNSRVKGSRLFSFPLEEKRCRQWVLNCGRGDLLDRSVEYIHANCCVCAAHFNAESFMNPYDNKCRLVWTAVPSIFDFTDADRPRTGKKSLPPEEKKVQCSTSDITTLDPATTQIQQPLLQNHKNVDKKIRVKTSGGARCAAVNCNNTSIKGSRLFAFPLEEERCKKWVENCRRVDLMDKSVEYIHAKCSVCAAHFNAASFVNPNNNKCRLVWNAVPTIFNFTDADQPRKKSLPPEERKVLYTQSYNEEVKPEPTETVSVEEETNNTKSLPPEERKVVYLRAYKKEVKPKPTETVYVEEGPNNTKDKKKQDTSMADEQKPEESPSTFKDLGVVDVLCEACERLKWKKPSKIQVEAIPLALEGKDVIGLAETGSGKTAAFALPILQALLEKPQRLFALVLTPTRELAYQISEQFTALGSTIGIKCAVIVGGLDMYEQALMLAKKPHVVVATPGRLVDHLENTKGFSLRSLKCLVMDEADRILNMDFGDEIDKIIQVIPRERKTYLFSATMTKKVQKLQRASLMNPTKVEVNSKYKTVDNLVQSYLFMPVKFKDVYLVYILNELAGNSFMVFSGTCNKVKCLAMMLRNLGFSAIPLHGQLTQDKRLGALNKFKSQESSILIATDVAARGLDIPHVDIVINFDIPSNTKDYIHRVGRTARAGRAGKAITFVSQYDVELYKRIEELIQKQLPLYKTEEAEVMQYMERVSEAQRFTKLELKSEEDKKAERKRRRAMGEDTEESSGVRRKFQKKQRQKK